MKSNIITSTCFAESDIRLDAKFHLSDGVEAKKLLGESPVEMFTLSQVTEKIFYGGRSKRNYIKSRDRGMSFLGSADMLLCDFRGLKTISSKHTANLESYSLGLNWTLVSRSGTIGNTVFTNKEFLDKAASEHIIRIVPNNRIRPGVLYAYLSSKYGYALMTQGTFGGVIQHIEPDFLSEIPIPNFGERLAITVSNLVNDSAHLKESASEHIKKAESIFFEKTGLGPINEAEYESYGVHNSNRTVSTFSIPSGDLSPLTINAFNHSQRIKNLTERIKRVCNHIPLADALSEEKFFLTGSFPRLEINSPKSIKLINQSDIFNFKQKGKLIARKNVSVNSLVSYGEILIAAVGTLGENETFCRVVFANESLVDQLVSGEFIRMKTSKKMPSGYLYTWLSSDYGFRLIRSTQTGTKLCRPIQKLLYQIPVPVLERSVMNEIHDLVCKAHTMRHNATVKENEALSLIEQEIELWQK